MSIRTVFSIREDSEECQRSTGQKAIALGIKAGSNGRPKCTPCGAVEDFLHCERCYDTAFRTTRKGNLRCATCHKKLPF